jgi:hypothetical protein
VLANATPVFPFFSCMQVTAAAAVTVAGAAATTAAADSQAASTLASTSRAASTTTVRVKVTHQQAMLPLFGHPGSSLQETPPQHPPTPWSPQQEAPPTPLPLTKRPLPPPPLLHLQHKQRLLLSLLLAPLRVAQLTQVSVLVQGPLQHACIMIIR